MLAPILVFTADEAWEFVPGRPAGSVHETDWKPTAFSLSQEECERWKFLFEKRAILLPHLESERKEKIIGKSLDAKLQLLETDPLLSKYGAADDSRELLNVSQLGMTKDRNAKLVVHADGQKCERCWHWEIDVGRSTAHPTLCGRCVRAVMKTD